MRTLVGSGYNALVPALYTLQPHGLPIPCQFGCEQCIRDGKHTIGRHTPRETPRRQPAIFASSAFRKLGSRQGDAPSDPARRSLMRRLDRQTDPQPAKLLP